MILKACPECDLQYDVSHLDAESHVRCRCDHVFSVGVPAALTLRAFSCSLCGGAVTLEDEACSYCSAKLTEESRRATTLCPKCYARLGDDSRHCNKCGVAIRPQALTPLPANKACPRCRGELRIRMFDEADAIECGDCGGLWLEPRLFRHIVLKAQTTLDMRFMPEETLLLAKAPGRESYIPCLRCEQLMLRKQYRHDETASGVVLDSCKHHGVWFDHAELETIVEFLRSGKTRRGAVPTTTQIDVGSVVRVPDRRPRETRSSTLRGSLFLELLTGLFGNSLWD